MLKQLRIILQQYTASKSMHCFEAPKPMLSKYIFTKQVLRGTVLENLANANPNIPSNPY